MKKGRLLCHGQIMKASENFRGRRPLRFDHDSRSARAERLAAGHLLGPLPAYHARARLTRLPRRRENKQPRTIRWRNGMALEP